MTDTDRVRIFDTTLRDGEQSPGAAMTLEEKLEVAELLDAMGVDIIEAGLPDLLDRRFRSRQRNRQTREECRHLRPQPRRLQGHRPRRRSAEACASVPHPHLHLHQPGPHEAQASDGARTRCSMRSATSVTRARNLTDDVQWSAEDATRTERDFLCRMRRTRDPFRRDDDQHPRHGGLYDAAGISSSSDRDAPQPRAEHRQGRSFPPIATTIWVWPWPIRWPASSAGARQVECTINGIGERAGNAALEEIVMALEVAPGRMTFTTGIKTEMHHPRLQAGARTSPAFPCSPTRPSSATMPSPMNPASTRTAC